MTSVLIIGGGGMIGQKLALSYKNSETVTLLDMTFPENSNINAKKIVGSVTDAGTLEKTLTDLPDTIFYLASVVSGEAEVDFSKGWDVNIHAFWSFLAQIRDKYLKSNGQYRPKIIFTSSIAVFGSPFPKEIPDDFLTAPRTSYGAQKACCELMLNDFIRKGFCEGLAIRLPTICVRPGKPNLAASSFFSGIIREPLNGLKPGGKYYFCEHGISPDFLTRMLQNITSVFYPSLSGGCHANRDIINLITSSGLVIEENSTMYLPGSVKFLGYNYWGIASR